MTEHSEAATFKNPSQQTRVAQATENQPDDDLDPDDVDASETESETDDQGDGRNDPVIDGPADKPAV